MVILIDLLIEDGYGVDNGCGFGASEIDFIFAMIALNDLVEDFVFLGELGAE